MLDHKFVIDMKESLGSPSDYRDYSRLTGRDPHSRVRSDHKCDAGAMRMQLASPTTQRAETRHQAPSA